MKDSYLHPVLKMLGLGEDAVVAGVLGLGISETETNWAPHNFPG